MVSILLFILKLIGFILLGILGLILLLVLIVLFVPIRYEVYGEFCKEDKTFKSKVRVSYLLRIVRFKMTSNNEKVEPSLKILWFDLLNKKEKKPKVKPKKATGDVREEKSAEKIELPDSNITENEEDIKEKEEKDVETHEPEVSKKSSKEDNKTNKKKTKKRSRIPKENKEKNFTIEKICDKINELIRAKDKILNFINDGVHRRALSLIKAKIIKLLKRLRPRKFKINGEIGFDNPALTGYAAAGYSVFYPYIGKYIMIHTDFENEVIDGTIYVKGKICVWYFLVFALSLIIKKEIRQSIKDVRSFKLK